MAGQVSGIGIGLRRVFVRDLAETRRRIDFVEVMPENWICYGGKRPRLLNRCLDRFPAVTHSVCLNIGGMDPLDSEFLDGVAKFCQQHDVPFWSDHICYSSVLGQPVSDLLPLPFTREVVEHTAARVRQAQAHVGRPLLLENATFYAHMPPPAGTPPEDMLDEASFLSAILEAGDCGMLLDVNNVYVNSRNHGFDPRAFMDRMPMDRVRQIHLAGHTDTGDVVIDTHIGPIIDPVWELYRYTIERAGRLIPTIIEWDEEIPPLDQVIDEADRARVVAQQALAACGGGRGFVACVGRGGLTMSRALEQFFADVGPFLLGQRSHTDAVQRLYGSSAATTARVDAERLAIYGRFCRNHRHEALTVFDGCRQAFIAAQGQAAWDDLVERYFVAHPMHHFELNKNGEHFPTFLQELVAAAPDSLPPFLGELADFEWWDWLVAVAPDDEGDGDPDAGPLRLASTVDLRPYTYDLVSWLNDGDDDNSADDPSQGDAAPRSAAPAARKNIVIFWRDRSLSERREHATPLELMLVKAIFEEVAIDGALAAQLAVPESELQETLADLQRAGIVLGSATGQQGLAE